MERVRREEVILIYLFIVRREGWVWFDVVRENVMGWEIIDFYISFNFINNFEYGFNFYSFVFLFIKRSR